GTLVLTGETSLEIGRPGGRLEDASVPDDLWEQTAPNNMWARSFVRLMRDMVAVLEGRPAAGAPATSYDGLEVQRLREAVRQRRLFLVGEIIHNPHVNKKLQAMGVEFLQRPDDGEFDFHEITPADVVILPAFGVTVKDFERLRAVGCVLVDTTCGSVLNVWKRVDSYAKDGFTAVIHGKYYHEETKATSSQVTKYPSGKYLVVRDMAEAREVCAYIEGAGSGEQFALLFEGKMSPGFDPARDLLRIGVANQTTM